jgi:peptide/nickel transport system permease protein
VLGLALGDLLYGAVLTETVFAWPGMGAWSSPLFRRSISRR